MLNLIRSDFYKLKKAKYFWICMAIAIALAIGTIFLLDFTYKMQGELMSVQKEQQQSGLDEAGMNLSLEGFPDSKEDLTASNQLLSFFSGNITLLLAVLISLFAGSEFNNGTIKNIATKNYSRGKIYLSKLFTSILVSIILTLIFVLVSTVTATFLWGFGDVSSGYWKDTLAAAGIELLLISAFASIFVMFSMIIRQNGGSLAVNICFLEFTSLVVMIGEMLLKKITGKTFLLSDYLLDTNMLAVCRDPGSSSMIRGAAVGSLFLAATVVIGMWNFSKRDIK